MKIIHTADIHLDSPLTQVSNPAERRRELLQALSRLGEFANNQGAHAVIVAGDLFDDQFTTDKTIQGVADIINSGNATWFVLQGNHGQDSRGEVGDSSPYAKLKNLCPNVRAFGTNWTNYKLDGVNICGRELGVDDQLHWQNLQLPADCFNILVLHGDVDDASYGLIDKKAIANCGANYVALGHRHQYAQHKFGKVSGYYSGALEGRGFDENCQTGFVVIDTQSNTVNFVKQSLRQVENVVVDVTDVQSDVALEQKLLQAVATCNPRNYLNVVLTGEVAPEMDFSYASKFLKGRFFALRVQDDTQPKWDLQKLSQEISLRGEFVRKVLQLPAEQQTEILKLGLTLLNGGELQ